MGAIKRQTPHATLNRVGSLEAVQAKTLAEAMAEEQTPAALLFIGRCIIAAGILTRFNPTPNGLRTQVEEYLNALAP